MTDEAESTALAPIPKESALAVLTNAERFNSFYEEVAKTVRGVPVDLTTSSGRKAVAALAFKVVKSKTAIVAAADLLTEDARAQIAKVNESKKDIQTRLDALRDEVRKPLSDWEAAEERREELVTIGLQALRDAAVIRADETALQIEERLTGLLNAPLSQDDYRDAYGIAMNLREHAITALTEGKARAVQAEADAAELATLREQRQSRALEDQERAEREAEAKREQEAQEQAERDESARIKREEEAEATRVENEKQSERDRLAREEQIAENARLETQRLADEAAEQQRVETQRQHDEELESERRKTQEADTERQRLADEATERDRLAQVEIDAAAARQKDRAHKAAVMAAAKVAIMSVIEETTGEPNEKAAVNIVRAIVAGEVPAVTLAF